jgi:uncharacterized protein (TIGR04255 family)
MIEFKTPPINELVLDIQFQPLKWLDTTALGDVREKLFKEAYPKYQEHPPLNDDIELNDGGRIFEFAVSPQLPPIRRQWYISADEERLFQFQQKRLIHNWRKKNLSDNNYPRFSLVFDEFKKYLLSLNNHSISNYREELVITQWEVTKFNLIPLHRATWKSDLSWIFTFLNNVSLEGNIETESVDFGMKSFMKSDDGTRIASLYTTLNMMDLDPERRAAILKISAKGPPRIDESTCAPCLGFMEDINKTIDKTFIALTTEKARKELWGQE